jgi:putative ABC transport system permease protein
VVWANLITRPAAGYGMSRWLAGFAYHLSLPVWLFPAAVLAALLIAHATTSTQSILLARAKPVEALRFE